MRNVYAVVSGEYSDYNVHYLFAELVDAENHIAELAGREYEDEPSIEKFRLYDKDQAPEVFAWFEERGFVMPDASVQGHRFARRGQIELPHLRSWVSNVDWSMHVRYGGGHIQRLEVIAQGKTQEATHKVFGEKLFKAQEAVKTGNVPTEYGATI